MQPTPAVDRSISFSVARQLEVYQRGSCVPVSCEALEARAREALTPQAFAYLSGGAGAEDTMRANLEAFRRWRIEPRVLRDLSGRDWRTPLLGTVLPAPVLLAPIGMQGIFHADAELATARAAASVRVPMILSSAASRPLEQVADAMADAPRWFQFYWSADAEVAASFLGRAERAGYSAIVVTVDCPILSWRERDLGLAYSPVVFGEGMANYLSDPVFRSRLARPPEEDIEPAVRRFVETFGNAALTWNDLPFLRRHTRLPIVLKGILRADDAARALDAGVDGLIVSNHGGRQVDGAVASLDALPRVAERVAGRVPVLLDSGIRRGADAFKALALGASAVLLGRPYAWGLAAAGEQGVREVLLNFLADLDLTFGLSGCASVAEVTRDFLRRE
ncbi:MAG TPA: alpha-hydroxy-acid oxidizing protein [Gemmatimonadales bacterium]|nr:alpha-hydroxy-acid oxidizing protein [Gemmatimonadales bacterium]